MADYQLTGECEACGRIVPKEKLKGVEEQYKSETIAVGTPGMVKNYYKVVQLCPRCRFLRKLSIVLAIPVGLLYGFLWVLFNEYFKPGAIISIIWALLNRLTSKFLCLSVYH